MSHWSGDDCPGVDLDDQLTPREGDERDRHMLAAIGVGGHIREEWGVRATWPGEDPDERWTDSEKVARSWLEFHKHSAATDVQMLRRYVITTAPTVVEEAP